MPDRDSALVRCIAGMPLRRAAVPAPLPQTLTLAALAAWALPKAASLDKVALAREGTVAVPVVPVAVHQIS